MNLVYAVIVDDYGAMHNKHEIREKLDEQLGEDYFPEELNPETWGSTPEAEKGNMDAMALAGML